MKECDFFLDEILNREDGPYTLPLVEKPEGLEQWRTKWVYDNKFFS